MSNQNRRSGEMEIRLETPQTSETSNPLGGFQFLIVRDLEELDTTKKKGARNSAKGKCQAVRAYIPNEPIECSIVGTCKTTSGYSMPEIKTTEACVFPAPNPSKTKGDYSEDCENTQSSQVSMSTGVGDSSEVDSRMTFKGSRQPCCRRSSRTTIHSSQNGQVDETDQRCLLSGREQMGDGAQQNPKEEVAFPVECFTQLYKRIEALEDLLQRGLESFKKEPCSCKEKCKNRKNPQPNKVKFTAPEKPKSEVMTLPEFIQDVLDSNTSSAPVASTNEEKESVGTDNEIQNIKKRVIALEEKLKLLKVPARKSNVREKSPSRNSFALVKLEKKNQSQQMTERHNDSAAQTNSDADSVQKSEIYLFNADLNESAGRKINSKVTKKIFKKYKKIKGECSSPLSSKKSSRSRNGSFTVWNCLSEQSEPRTRSFESTLCRYPLSNDSDKSKQAAAVVYLRCQNASVAWPPERHSERKRRRVKDLCRKVPVTNLFMSQFTERENGICDPNAFGDCKVPGSCKKTSRSKRRSKRYLVSRHSPTGVHSFHRRHTAWTIAKRSSRHHPFVDELGHRRHKDGRNRERESKRERCPRKSRHTETKDMSNVDEKLKIPVLFKEICKPMKPVQKISNFSMRFVLVENDPSNPLRALMEKLSKGKSQKKEEQYVFGVSKCSCDESRNAPPKMFLRGGSSKPADEGPILGPGAGQKLAGGGLHKIRPEGLYI